MKSNEEFIAGIYEKAAVYTEEKETNIVKVNWVAKATRIAAMVAVCIGLAGVATMTFDKTGSNPVESTPEIASEDYGIALTAELGAESGEATGGAAQLRMGPVVEIVTFTGKVEQIDTKENVIWMQLLFDENAPDYAEESVVCIRWDLLEPISEKITVGTTLTATGALSVYENEESEQNGSAVLVLTDMANLKIK